MFLCMNTVANLITFLEKAKEMKRKLTAKFFLRVNKNPPLAQNGMDRGRFMVKPSDFGAK